MNQLRTAALFLFAIVCSTKCMEQPTVDIADTIINEIATRNDDVDDRIEDLKNLSLTNKYWKKVIDDLAEPLIMLLAGGPNADPTKEYLFEKVHAAVGLGKRSEQWIIKSIPSEEFYSEELYKDLLYCFTYSPGRLGDIRKLQNINDFFNRVANEQTEDMVTQICKIYNDSISNDEAACLVDTRKVKYAHHQIINISACLHGWLNDRSRKFRASSLTQGAKIDFVKRAITLGADANYSFPRSDCSTWCKALDGNLDIGIIKALLKTKARLKKCRACKKTFLEKAISCNRVDAITELFKRSDSDINRLNLAVQINQNCLSEILEMLIAHPQCDINATDEHKRTPLMLCCIANKSQIAELLMKRPDINSAARDEDGQTAYDIAIDLGLSDFAKKIKEKESVRAEQKGQKQNYGKVLRNSTFFIMLLVAVGYFQYA